MSQQRSGDRLDSLPLDNNYSAQPGELEFAYNLFQPKNKQLVKQTVSTVTQTFARPLAGALLFVLLSLPFAAELASKIGKGNSLYGKVILAVVFFVAFFVLDKYWIK